MTNRRPTKSILHEIADRIADRCSADGRDDLVEALSVIERLAIANKELAAARRELLQILERDNETVAAGSAKAKNNSPSLGIHRTAIWNGCPPAFHPKTAPMRLPGCLLNLLLRRCDDRVEWIEAKAKRREKPASHDRGYPNPWKLTAFRPAAFKKKQNVKITSRK